MSKKRRMFDIDFPGEAPEASPRGQEAAETGTRRGPMASAIVENADALAARRAAEAAIREENDRLAHEHVRLKKAGLITDLIPIEAVRTDKLVRDRRPGRDPELDELKRSIREIGLSNPIRVEQTEEGYELVQGYRRLSAYRELYEETGEALYARIPAGLIAHGERLEALYRRMVDENLVRRDVSFAEMAELARRYAADPETEAETVEAAVAHLFSASNRQKRNYIGRFANLLDQVGDALRFAEAMPRALGLELEKRLGQEPGFAADLRAALAEAAPAEAEEELAVLRGLVWEEGPRIPATPRSPARGAAKTAIRYTSPGGMVRCTASDGKIELRAERDFSALDRQALEGALEAFFKALDERG